MARYQMTLLALLFCASSCLAVSPDEKSPWLIRDSYVTSNGTHTCCSFLSSRLEGKVFYPDSPVYIDQQTGFENGYWTELASSLQPACRVAPQSTKDVALAVQTLVHAGCQFAVKGGGHTPFAGAANIDGGVTIDLGAIDDVTTTKRTASIGGGARWEDVYPKLDALGLAVPGGRNTPLGVGGVVLGGGNSFFNSLVGFACDAVLNYEIVLASGEIVNANADQNSDLYRALKGGSNNFGIVTRFDMQARPQGNLWGGLIIYDIEARAELYQALEDFTTLSGDGVDDQAAMLMINVYEPLHRAVAIQPIYAKPEPYPPILKSLTDIQPQLQQSNTLRISTLTNFTSETNAQIRGRPRGYFGTLTVGNNAELFTRINGIFNSSMAIAANITGIVASSAWQPIPRSTTNKADLTGGNSLGLDASRDRMLIDLGLGWFQSSDDAFVLSLGQSIIDQCIAAAIELGLYEEYVALNYALPTQDPIASYGEENIKAMWDVSRKYDPKGVFQRLVPGGFKLPKVTGENE